MNSLLVEYYLQSKIDYTELYNYYNSDDYYVSIPVKDFLKKYNNFIGSTISNQSRTIQYVNLIHKKLCDLLSVTIVSQLRSLLSKFDKYDYKNDNNFVTLLNLLPSDIKELFVKRIQQYYQDINIETITDDLNKLELYLNNLDSICELDKLLVFTDCLNDILEMLYESRKWYKLKEGYLNSPDGEYDKKIFDKYCK